MQISMRSSLTAGMALTTAGAIALTPLVIQNAPPPDIALPSMSTTGIQMAAAINPADITALIDNLDAAMSSVSSTVSSLTAAEGQTLVESVNSAAALNNTLWDGLIAATGNPTLRDVLTALKASSDGGLTKLAATVAPTGDTLTLTSGQMADLLTSTLTGSLGTALHAVTSLTNNPMAAASSFPGLVNVPLGLAGLVINNGLAAARDLGVNGLGLANSLVHGVTGQITNILAAVNALTSKGVTGLPLFDGLVTAVQGIVSAPITVGVAGLNGVSSALTGAASIALTQVTTGAGAVVNTWLGNGSTPGALAAAINSIGAAPLSPAGYTNAISILVGAAATTVSTLVDTAAGLTSLPFTTGATLTTTAGHMITSLSTAVATTAAGLMQMAGLPAIVYNLPHALAAGINGAVTMAAAAASAVLNGIGLALDIGAALTGAASAPQMITLSIPAASQSTTAEIDSAAGVSESQPAIGTNETEAEGNSATQDVAVDQAAQAAPVSAETEEVSEIATATIAQPPESTDAVEPEQTEATTAQDTKSDQTTTDLVEAEETETAPEDAPTTDPTTSATNDTEDDAPKAVHTNTNRQGPDTGPDEPDIPGSADDNSSGTTAGGKHAQDTVKNGTTVSEIKSKLDNERSSTGVSTPNASDTPA